MGERGEIRYRLRNWREAGGPTLDPALLFSDERDAGQPSNDGLLFVEMMVLMISGSRFFCL
jgi:hypothetical protein